MHAIAINKNLDYSVPIIFKPYVAAPVPVAKIVSAPVVAAKPNVPVVQKSVVTKAPVNKAATQIKKEEKKTTTIASPKNIATASTKKIEEKPSLDTSLKTKTPEMNGEEKKVITEPTKPVVSTEKKEESKIAPVAEKKQPLSDPAKPASLESPVQNDLSAIALAKEEVEHEVKNAITSDNFREVEALRRGAQLQKELVQKWQPPIGVSPECSCEISFFVDKKGAIHQLKMVKNSGIAVFDISARQALFAMKMPQWTYGKPLTISFKQ